MERLGMGGKFVDGLRVSDEATVEGAKMGLVGQQKKANVLLHIAEDYIPVVASVGADREGNSYNVNADAAAAAVAEALGAYKVIFLTDVEGWRSEAEDPASLISEATAGEVRERLGEVGGGMRPKLEACLHALAAGAGEAPHV